MNAGETAGFAERRLQPFPDSLRHPIRIAAQLLGPILGQLRDRRPRVVPVVGTVLVEVGGRARQPSERISEDGRGLSRQHAAELDAPVLDSPLRRPCRWRGTKVDRARDAPAGGELSEVGHLAVEPVREGVRPVDVLLDHGCPVVGKVAGQFGQDLLIVDGEVGGEDERTPVTFLPQAVNDRRHQSKDPARALERHQGRPIGVQAIEDLGVYGVCGLQPLLVVGIPALRRKLLVLRAVVVGERPRDDIPIPKPLRVFERFEEASPDDFEAFLGARRPPRRLDASDDVPQPGERLPAALPADLYIVRLGVR